MANHRHTEHIDFLDKRFDAHHHAAIDAYKSWEINGKGDMNHQDYQAYERHLRAAANITFVIDRCVQHGL